MTSKAFAATAAVVATVILCCASIAAAQPPTPSPPPRSPQPSTLPPSGEQPPPPPPTRPPPNSTGAPTGSAPRRFICVNGEISADGDVSLAPTSVYNVIHVENCADVLSDAFSTAPNISLRLGGILPRLELFNMSLHRSLDVVIARDAPEASVRIARLTVTGGAALRFTALTRTSALDIADVVLSHSVTIVGQQLDGGAQIRIGRCTIRGQLIFQVVSALGASRIAVAHTAVGSAEVDATQQDGGVALRFAGALSGASALWVTNSNLSGALLVGDLDTSASVVVERSMIIQAPGAVASATLLHVRSLAGASTVLLTHSRFIVSSNTVADETRGRAIDLPIVARLAARAVCTRFVVRTAASGEDLANMTEARRGSNFAIVGCNACPAAIPFSCWNGECAFNASRCTCPPSAAIFCPTLRQCVPRLADCPCPASNAGGVRCTVERCAASSEDCANRTQQGGAGSEAEDNCVAEAARPRIVIATPPNGVVDIDRPQYFTASATLLICGRDRSASLRVTWRIISGGVDVVMPSRSGEAARLEGLTAFVPSGFLPAANAEYLLFVTATATINGTVFSESASATFVGVRVTQQLWIVGGAERAHPSSVALRLEAVSLDEGTMVSRELRWNCTNCCATEGDASCQLRDALRDASGANTVIRPPLPPGNWTIRAGNAEQRLSVLQSEFPVVSIITRSNGAIEGSSFAVVAAVHFNSSVSQFEWRVNGTVASGAIGPRFVIPAAQLVADATITVTVRVRANTTTAGSVWGFATTVIRVAPRLTGACAVIVSPSDESGAESSGEVLALESKLRIVVVSQGGVNTWSSSTGLEFAYSFASVAPVTQGQQQQQQLMPLSGRFLASNTFDFVAPVLPSRQFPQRANVTFVVTARVAATRETAGEFRCVTSVTAQRIGRAASMIQEREKVVAAALNNDTAAVLRAASSSVVLIGDSASLSEATQTARAVASAIRQSIDGERALGANIGGGTKDAAVDIIAAIAANSTLLSGGGAGGSPTTAAAMRRELVDALRAVLRPSSSVGSGSEVDAASRGTSVLRTIAILSVNTEGAARAGIDLAMSVARSAPLGSQTRLDSGDYSVAGARQSALAVNGATVATAGTTLTLPPSFSLSPNATAENIVAISALEIPASDATTQFAGAAVLPGRRQMPATPAADFTLQLDGSEIAVGNLSAEAALTIHLRVGAPLRFNTTNLTCAFFSARANAWVTDGVTTLSFDAATSILTCRTTHLSTFMAFAEETATDSPTTTGSSGTPASPAPSSTLAINGSFSPAPSAPPGNETAAPAPTNGPTAEPTPTSPDLTGGSPGDDDSSNSLSAGVVAIIVIAAVIIIAAAVVLFVKTRTTKPGAESGRAGGTVEMQGIPAPGSTGSPARAGAYAAGSPAAHEV